MAVHGRATGVNGASTVAFRLCLAPLSTMLDETHHLIGERELRQMKPRAILINTSRGPVVDEAALFRALTEGWIAAAGIDVLEQEPPPADNPLFSLDNVVITPHIAGYTDRIAGGQLASVGRDCPGAWPRGAGPVLTSTTTSSRVGGCKGVESMKGSDLKKRLHGGEPVYGTWSASTDPLVAATVARAGFDWVSVDMEHSPRNVESLRYILWMIRETPTVAMVRVKDNRPDELKQALDQWCKWGCHSADRIG